MVLPINQTRHLASSSEEIFGSCCLISTDELLIKSDNTQVALPNQPLLLELPSLLQSLLYRCDHHRSSPIISDHHRLSAGHLLSTSKKIQTLCQSRNIYLRLRWPSCVWGGPHCSTRLWGGVSIEKDQHRRSIFLCDLDNEIYDKTIIYVGGKLGI